MWVRSMVGSSTAIRWAPRWRHGWGGMARDTFGGYALAFLVAGVLAMAGAMMAMRINRAPQVAAPSVQS